MKELKERIERRKELKEGVERRDRVRERGKDKDGEEGEILYRSCTEIRLEGGREGGRRRR